MNDEGYFDIDQIKRHTVGLSPSGMNPFRRNGVAVDMSGMIKPMGEDVLDEEEDAFDELEVRDSMGPPGKQMSVERRKSMRNRHAKNMGSITQEQTRWLN